MKITQLHAVRVRIPQKPPIAPYQNRYKAGTHKESLLIRLETDGGLVGWGETPDDWINRSFEETPEDRLRGQALRRDPFDIEAWHAGIALRGWPTSGPQGRTGGPGDPRKGPGHRSRCRLPAEAPRGPAHGL